MSTLTKTEYEALRSAYVEYGHDEAVFPTFWEAVLRFLPLPGDADEVGTQTLIAKAVRNAGPRVVIRILLLVEVAGRFEWTARENWKQAIGDCQRRAHERNRDRETAKCRAYYEVLLQLGEEWPT